MLPEIIPAREGLAAAAARAGVAALTVEPVDEHLGVGSRPARDNDRPDAGVALTAREPAALSARERQVDELRPLSDRDVEQGRIAEAGEAANARAAHRQDPNGHVAVRHRALHPDRQTSVAAGS